MKGWDYKSHFLRMPEEFLSQALHIFFFNLFLFKKNY